MKNSGTREFLISSQNDFSINFPIYQLPGTQISELTSCISEHISAHSLLNTPLKKAKVDTF